MKIYSPLGPLYLRANNEALIGIFFDEADSLVYKVNAESLLILKWAAKELTEYFEHKRQEFSVPLAFAEGTAFQQKVWQELQSISYGKLRSYSEHARLSVGNIRSVRAVGGAIGKNPLSIILPCHRVMGKDGSITGYSGGIDIKYWLLKHEGHYSNTAYDQRKSIRQR